MSLLSAAYAGSAQDFVPTDFKPPESVETERFRLRPLTIHHLVKDYDAVISSRRHLNELFGSGWPEGLTLEQNLVDLGWHQKEFQRRTSFAYTVLAPDESRVLGCVYIYPTRKPGFDAAVYLWARQSELAGGLEVELRETVRDWLAANWPFKNPALSGSDPTGVKGSQE
ncbi:MAG: hypothetical protein RQ826_00070 [Xanthomonadales bacterium]|nr:hypothetical protein [Xanthomonadales bacterium]